jgi:hypoxanthine phosphoribosyltransferase
MSKIYYNDQQIRKWLHNIVRDMNQDQWRPELIVGLTRGGLVPATMLSHYLDVPMSALNVSLRDSDLGPTSDTALAEEAYGYDGRPPKRILIVDDINDSGDTLQWIIDDWQQSCPNYGNQNWDGPWFNTTRFATLINNEASKFKHVNYIGTTINKLENPVWCVFPWENWWEH